MYDINATRASERVEMSVARSEVDPEYNLPWLEIRDRCRAVNSCWGRSVEVKQGIRCGNGEDRPRKKVCHGVGNRLVGVLEPPIALRILCAREYREEENQCKEESIH